MPLAEKLLEVPIDLARAALDLETSEGTVIADSVRETRCVFLAGLHRAEHIIAERLVQLANGKLPWAWIDPDKALTWVEDRIELVLAESQVAAIRLALTSKSLVMTGGVGKTTIVKDILRSKRRAAPAMRANWPRRQAHDRGDRFRSQNHSPAA